MKKSLTLLAFGMGLSASAHAVYIPPAGTPLYIKFSGQEQLCVTGNCITAPNTSNPGAPTAPSGTVGGAEQNWGILNVSTVFLGSSTIPPDGLYNPTGIPLWSTLSASQENAQITGIFYGIQTTTGSNPIQSTGGYLDLWWQGDINTVLNPAGTGTYANTDTALPGQRTAVNGFTNFTDGTFLARLAFAPGIDPTYDKDINIVGTLTPTGVVVGGISGLADSYADVMDVNGDGIFDASDGLWASLLNGNAFPVLVNTDDDANTAPVSQARDFRFKNSYNRNTAWDIVSGDQLVAVGAVLDDPARNITAVIPEPGTLALGSLGLLALGFAGRRRKV